MKWTIAWLSAVTAIVFPVGGCNARHGTTAVPDNQASTSEAEPSPAQLPTPDDTISINSTISLPRNVKNVEPPIRRLIDRQVTEIQNSSGAERAAAHAKLGLIYEANGLWPEARRAFQSAIALDEDNAAYRFHLAVAQYESGELDQAVSSLQHVVDEAPDLAPAFQRLGVAYLAQGRFAEAEAAFRRMVQLAPDAAESHAALGDALLRQGRLTAAESALRRSLSIDPQYKVAAFLLGTTFQRQGNDQQAIRLLRYGQGATIRYLQDDLARQGEQYGVTLRVRHRKALRQLAAGETQAAIENLRAALAEHPNHVAMLNALAGALMRQNKRQEAFELLQKAKAIDSSQATTDINLASWYLAAGQLELALKHAQAAVERSSWILTAHYLRIETLIKMNRIQQARRALVQALRRSPGDAQLRRYARQLGPGSDLNKNSHPR